MIKKCNTCKTENTKNDSLTLKLFYLFTEKMEEGEKRNKGRKKTRNKVSIDEEIPSAPVLSDFIGRNYMRNYCILMF